MPDAWPLSSSMMAKNSGSSERTRSASHAAAYLVRNGP